MSRRYFHELRIGDTIDLGTAKLSNNDITEFSRRYDPQPRFIDESVAEPLYNGFVASPWHGAVLAQSLVVKGFVNHVADMGHFEVSNFSSSGTIHPEQSVRGEATIAELRDQAISADRGEVALDVCLFDKDEQQLLTFTSHLHIARKPRAN